MRTIKIDRSLKLRLLRAIQSGCLDVDSFPELFDLQSVNTRLLTTTERDTLINELKVKLYE